MPGYMRCFKENQGTHIEGNGESIDVVVRKIINSGPQKEANIEIIGIPGLKEVHLSPSNRDVDLIPGIKLGIVHRERKSGRPVYLSYYCEEGYSLKPKNY